MTPYVAGVCNIGREEIALRRRLGWISLAVTVLLLGALVWMRANSWWRLLVFLPATMSATGFLQAHYHFCPGFARRGVFNFGPVGQKEAVSDDDAKAKDRAWGNRIGLYSALIGALVAIASVGVGRVW